MNLIKRGLICCVCIWLVFYNSLILVNAQNYIDSTEVQRRVTELSSKYNVQVEVLETSESEDITEEELQQELEKLEEMLKVLTTSFYVEEPSEGGAMLNSMARVMEINKTYTTYAYLTNSLLAGAQIELSCNAKINIGSGEFMSISNISTRQYGGANYFVSWTQTGSGFSYINGGTQASVWANGTLVTEVDILGRSRMTLDHTIMMTINAN